MRILMLKKIDSSQLLVRFLERLSTLLARRRGLPVVAGILLIALGFIVELINTGVGLSSLEIIHVILHNVGVLIALIGLLLAEPLGE
jgi:hypothetical protein